MILSEGKLTEIYRLHVGHMRDDWSRSEFDNAIAGMSEEAYADYERRLNDAKSAMYKLHTGPQAPHLHDAEVQVLRWLPKNFTKQVYAARPDLPEYWIAPSPTAERKHYERMQTVAKIRR